MLPQRLTGIDDTNRAQHWYLEQTDKCLFIGEYFSGKGYEGGATNQLIFNLKCKPSTALQNPKRGYWKDCAINEVVAALPRILSTSDIEEHTWVPVPPSKCSDDANYDPRLERILAGAFHGYNADIRMLLRQTQNTAADHEAAGGRLPPQNLDAVVEIDRHLLASSPIRSRGIILFDDVLVTGKHFKCCQRHLRAIVVEIPIKGVFIARRVLVSTVGAHPHDGSQG